jgi:hypothetical protein
MQEFLFLNEITIVRRTGHELAKTTVISALQGWRVTMAFWNNPLHTQSSVAAPTGTQEPFRTLHVLCLVEIVGCPRIVPAFQTVPVACWSVSLFAC